ncbi:hypothetical protein GBF38_019769 [Nibea albiflora]|uniref:Uncharacterized protein n=1 Tax=Nibea albiflora TaxID=240163 RepID=A0ACB7F258_NIBAL|nr:hypothetical protein GBF38_019769 [Nibea albiflora]
MLTLVVGETERVFQNRRMDEDVVGGTWRRDVIGKAGPGEHIEGQAGLRPTRRVSEAEHFAHQTVNLTIDEEVFTPRVRGMLTGSNGGMGTRTNIVGLSRSRAWQREETKEDDGRSLKK